MRNLFRTLALPAMLLFYYSSHGQVATAPKDYYVPPVGIQMYLSANFGEVRSDHFHSGIDVKTGGKEGEPLYSVADGYISRIAVSPTGFGRAIYIDHPNGTTSVYAHMQRFEPEIEAWMTAERYRQRSYRLDVNIDDENKFPVVKGQRIGLSGNSGSSLGPHLHFEIRDTPSQRVHDIIKLGFYDLEDDIPPTLVRLHYIAVDTINGVPVNAKPKTYELASSSRGVYHTADTSALKIPRSGYFVLEATDRKNDTHNTFGIYGVDLEMDSEGIFSYRLDSFLFGNTRYVNSYTHYGMQKGSRNELLRLAVQDGNKLPVYSGVKNRGAVYLGDESVHRMKITAHDDSGNTSTLIFRVTRSDEYRPLPEPEGIPVDNRRAFTRSSDGLMVSIPANSLYEPIYYRQSIDEAAGQVKTAPMSPVTPVYRVHREDTPLHNAMTVTIDVPEASGDHSKLCLARVSSDGRKYSYVGGQYSNGRVSATTRNFGLYTVVCDTKAPTITPSFANGADLGGEESISFNITDDFSGVASFTGEIDGKWILFERQGAAITHYFATSPVDYTGGEHTLVLKVTDNRGNTNTATRTFIR